MKQLQGSKAAAKLFSPAAFALAVGLACWGSAALGTSNPIPGIDIIVRKKPGGSIVVTPTSDHSGKFSVKLGSGDYTVSTACKSGGCTPSQLSLNVAGKSYPNADGTMIYEFTVGKGGIELRGQTLNIDPPKGGGANLPSKLSPSYLPDAPEFRTPSKFPPGSGPVSTTVKLQQPPPNQLRAGVLPVPGDYDGDGVETRTTNPTNGRDGELPGKKHNYKGVVTLVRGTVPNPDSGKEAGGDGQNKVWQLMQGQTGAVAADPSSGEGDDLPGKKHNFVGSVTLIRGTAPNLNSGGEMLPGKIGDPIPGVPIGLEGDPGSVKVSSKTDGKGAFDFSNLPEGKYKLKLPGLPDQSVIVGREGKVGGNLMKGSDGEMMIFDRWGNLIATPITVEHENFKVTNDREKMSIAAPNNDVDTTPQNKYADDFTQLNTKLDALAIQVAGVTTLTTDMSSVKAQVTALQTAVAGLPTTASITALQTSLGSVDTKIDAITTTLNTVATAGTATKAIVDGLKTDLTAFAAKVTADNLAMKAQSTALKKEDKKNASVDNAVSGFGTGMGGSPGRGPDIGGMGVGPNPSMMSPPGGMGSGPVSPVSGGGPAGGPGAMSPGGQGGPVSSMHP